MECNRTYNKATTVYFPLVTAGGTDFQTTWTPAAGETQYSIDGGAFANTGSNPSHEGNGIWSLALTAAELTGQYIVVTVSDGATDIEDQAIVITTDMSGQLEANQGIIILEVDSGTFTPSSTAFEAFRLWPNVTEETTADHYLQRKLLWTSGNLTGIMTTITDFELANSKEKFTYVATSTAEAPADGDRAVVL